MDFASYASYVKRLVSFIPFGVFDVVVLVAALLYIFEDASFGILAAGTGFVSIIIAFFIGLALYHPVSEFIAGTFFFTKGISDAIAFLVVTSLSFSTISLILTLIRKRFILIIFPKKIDQVGGAFFGFLSFFFIASFVVALLLSFPAASFVKDSIRDSVSGRYLFSQMQMTENYVRQIFGGAINDTINFLTIKPESSESIPLNFKTENYKVDQESQDAMLILVNRERVRAGLSAVNVDQGLTSVGKLHAEDMLKRGYFSHYTPEGFSPFDRMEQGRIFYTTAGENLAFAPDVQIAMDGLMKSPGHRANILSVSFNKIGISVLDAGIHGKVFVQEFTD